MEYVESRFIRELVRQEVEEQASALLGLREEIVDALRQGDDANLLESAPNHLATTVALGNYRWFLDLLDKAGVEVPAEDLPGRVLGALETVELLREQVDALPKDDIRASRIRMLVRLLVVDLTGEEPNG